MTTPDPFDDDEEDFRGFLWEFFRGELAESMMRFRLVLPDEIVDNLTWEQARNCAEQAIREAGYARFNFEQVAWQVEYYVRLEDDTWFTFASVESEED